MVKDLAAGEPPKGSDRIVLFWDWFAYGSGGDAGWRKALWNWWSLGHVAVGVVMAFLVDIPLKEASSAVLFPLAGAFVGLSFAWAGNAQALLQTSEIENLSTKAEGGFADYVYTFQSAVLVILVTLGLWGLAGLGVLDRSCFWNCARWVYFIPESIVYALSSLTLRESWHVVLGAQYILVARRKILERKAEEQMAGDITRD